MKIPVHTGQIEYEKQHLLRKLEQRDPPAAIRLEKESKIALHPIFEPVKGDVEPWEILPDFQGA